MKIGKTSRTAQYMALFRALESNRKADDRLFTDPFAIYFLDMGLRLATRASKIRFIRNFVTRIIKNRIPGAFSSALARTRYIDDLLQNTIADGVKQVVILGAGFDTRASRLGFVKSVPVIEIDHPNTSGFKIKIIKKYFGKLPDNITYCQIDFNHQSLEQLAEQNNFDFTLPTTIIWEGVTNYLTEEAIDKTFLFIAKYPRGSYVVFTYVHKQVLDNPGSFLGGKKLLTDLERIEEHWTFGFLPNQLPGYLQRFDLELIEDLGATEYRHKYLPNRSENGYEFYRVALTKKR